MPPCTCTPCMVQIQDMAGHTGLFEHSQRQQPCWIDTRAHKSSQLDKYPQRRARDVVKKPGPIYDFTLGINYRTHAMPSCQENISGLLEFTCRMPLQTMLPCPTRHHWTRHAVPVGMAHLMLYVHLEKHANMLAFSVPAKRFQTPVLWEERDMTVKPQRYHARTKS